MDLAPIPSASFDKRGHVDYYTDTHARSTKSSQLNNLSDMYFSNPSSQNNLLEGHVENGAEWYANNTSELPPFGFHNTQQTSCTLYPSSPTASRVGIHSHRQVHPHLQPLKQVHDLDVWWGTPPTLVCGTSRGLLIWQYKHTRCPSWLSPQLGLH